MPQNSTIILSLFYHLSSSFRVHHYPPIIINAPSFRLNHSYHLSSSFRDHSIIQSFIIISPLFRLYFTTYHHHSAIILPLLPLSSSISPLQHLSSSFHHHSVIIPYL